MSRAMTVALGSNNIIHFVDDTFPKPPLEDLNFLSWDRCNKLVLSWINHSLNSCINCKECVLWMEFSSEVWKNQMEFVRLLAM